MVTKLCLVCHFVFLFDYAKGENKSSHITNTQQYTKMHLNRGSAERSLETGGANNREVKMITFTRIVILCVIIKKGEIVSINVLIMIAGHRISWTQKKGKVTSTG